MKLVSRNEQVSFTQIGESHKSHIMEMLRNQYALQLFTFMQLMRSSADTQFDTKSQPLYPKSITDLEKGILSFLTER